MHRDKVGNEFASFCIWPKLRNGKMIRDTAEFANTQRGKWRISRRHEDCIRAFRGGWERQISQRIIHHRTNESLQERTQFINWDLRHLNESEAVSIITFCPSKYFQKLLSLSGFNRSFFAISDLEGCNLNKMQLSRSMQRSRSRPWPKQHVYGFFPRHKNASENIRGLRHRHNIETLSSEGRRLLTQRNRLWVLWRGDSCINKLRN